MRADVITLVNERPNAHGIFEPKLEERREVFCQIRSIGVNEFYRALEQDLHPVCTFILADYAEYHDEKIVEWHGKRLRVVRTYVGGQTIELTVEEATVDA